MKEREMSGSEEFDKVTNAYHAAIELWKLASQQIYSRFAAMLTGNSIIIAIIGLAITDKVDIPYYLVKWLTVSGFILCVVWLFFMIAGWHVESHYREKAIQFEKDATGKEIAFPTKGVASWSFMALTVITIIVFMVIYGVLLGILLTRN